MARLGISLVPAEHLVAAVTGERDGDMPARHLRDEIRGDLGGVGERLVVHRRQERDDVTRLIGAEIEFVVLGAEVPGNCLGVLRLVEARLVEPDGEGQHRTVALLLHESHDGSRVDTTRQQCPERHVRHHFLTDRRAEPALHRRHNLRIGAMQGVTLTRRHRIGQLPVRFNGDRAGGIDRRDVAGKKLADATIDGEGRGNVVVPGIEGQRVAIDVCPGVGVRPKCLQFAAEQEGLPDPPVVEGLFSEAITDEMEQACLAVPEGKGELAGHALHRGHDAPGDEGRKHHLGVGVTAKGLAQRLEVPAQLGEVVDLAVEDDQVAAIVRPHGLVALDREIEDRQASMTQRHTGLGVEPDPCIVGAPVRHRIRHGTQTGLGVPAESTWRPESGDTAHVYRLPRRRRAEHPAKLRKRSRVRARPSGQ